MPGKRRAQEAPDTSSQAFYASVSSSADGSMLNGSSPTSPSSSKSMFGRIKEKLFSSASRKRQKLEAHSKSNGTLLLTLSPSTPDSASSTAPASGFVDLTPSKAPLSTAPASDKDTQPLLSSQEGAIRDPLQRTTLGSSPPSTDSAMIVDTRSSSEEATETQIQHTSPPSSPVIPNATLQTELEPKQEAALLPTPVQDESAATSSQSEPRVDDGHKDAKQAEPEQAAALDQATAQREENGVDSQSELPIDDADKDAEEIGPTDADVDHIQAVADAKVGEHIEGLLDWSGTLSSDEPPLPSARAFDADSPKEHQQDAIAAKDPNAEVVDLVSDSEQESDSANDDPDKENDVSLVSATPRLDSDAQLPTFSGQAFSQPSSQPSGSRHSLFGPLAQRSQQKSHIQAPTEPRFTFEEETNNSPSADVSATETVRSIGRQGTFVRPSRQRVPLHSTPLPTAQPGQRDRSFSFSSNTSTPSLSALSITTNSPTRYKKRAPIDAKKHQHKVDRYNQSKILNTIETARQTLNRFRSSSRQLRREHFGALVAYSQQVHELVAKDNSKDVERGKFFDDMMQRMMRQQQLDAQTGILPLPPVKLEQRQRMQKEQKLRERRLRGILGRLRLPTQLEPEQEQAASIAFSKRGTVSEITGASVSDQDVRRLRPGVWLNDEIINFYGTLILNRANDADKKRTEAMAAVNKDAPAPSAPPAPSSNSNGKSKDKAKGKPTIPSRPYDKSLDAFWRVHFFNSFFWTNLKSKGYDGVKRWTRRVDLFSKDIILFPINIGDQHWVCGAINMRKHRFEYYDSLGASNSSVFRIMRDYITQEARDKKKKEIDLRGWTDYFGDESPQQENAFDCGVFASQTIEQLSRRDPFTPIPLGAPSIVWKGESLDDGAQKLSLGSAAEEEDDFDNLEYEWNFRQENMPYLRKRMAYEIFSKQLLG